LADIPIGGPEYRQFDRVVQEIDGLAEILIGDGTHYHQKVHSVPVPYTGHGGK
jgi:3-deoxy-D-arabino-heptulosonate 7-phosphate (DAHP) synthase class II